MGIGAILVVAGFLTGKFSGPSRSLDVSVANRAESLIWFTASTEIARPFGDDTGHFRGTTTWIFQNASDSELTVSFSSEEYVAGYFSCSQAGHIIMKTPSEATALGTFTLQPEQKKTVTFPSGIHSIGAVPVSSAFTVPITVNGQSKLIVGAGTVIIREK